MERIPDGEYEGSCWIDSDGLHTFNIPIRVAVRISGDRAVVDYTGSGPQGEGSLNGSYATSQAAGAVPFLNYIDPDIPHNEGCIQHIDVIAPEGTICNARYPASTSSATIVPSDAMQDAVHKAMAAAAPDLVIAGSARCGNVPQFSGVDPESGVAWGAMLFNNTGAQGASKRTDGWPLYESSAAAGGLKAQSIEQIELLYPMRIEQMEIETDSMGAGEWIGGPGVRMVVASLGGEMECITFGDGCANPPHGVLGGTPAIGGGQYVESSSTGARRYITASGHVRVGPDEVYVGVSTGGGGYGDPLDRPAETVRQDVRDGLVSRARARDVFGVILGAGLDPGLDEEATAALRAELRQGRLPAIVTPTEPASGPESEWAERDRRPGDVYLVNPVS
jgi:N-methylhydantoinase B